MTSLTLVPDPDDDSPAGMALVAGDVLNGGRIYICDPAGDQIDVLDDAARPLFSFGGHGAGPGQFKTPVDLAIVSATGEQALTSVADAVIVVADRDNHRLQMFTLDGAWLATIDDTTPGPRAGWPLRTGWPYFRIGASRCVRFPSRLRWRAPYLDVTSGLGGVVRVDVPVVFLPDFNAWLKGAPPPELRRALRSLSRRADRHVVPDHCLRRIARRILVPERAAAGTVVRQ